MANVIQPFHALKHVESVRVGLGGVQLGLKGVKFSIGCLGFRFKLGFHYDSGGRCLREPNEVRADTEARTRAR